MRVATLFAIYYACALYGAKNPFFGLLFFIHITILRPESLVWDNVVFGRLHLVTSLILLTSYVIRSSHFKGDIDERFQKKSVLILFGFVLSLAISSMLAEASVQTSFEKALDIFKIFVLCLLFSRMLNTKKRIEAYIWVVGVSFGMMSFWGLLQGMVGNPRLDNVWTGGSNGIAAVIALMAPFSLSKVFDRALSLGSKCIFLACTLSMVVCSAYTASRGGFLGLIVGILAFVLLTRERVKVLAVLLLSLILIHPWIPEHYLDRINSIYANKGERDLSADSRPVLWKIAFRIWQDHPIFGVGLENFSPVKETYSTKVADIVTSEEMYSLIFRRYRVPHGTYPGMLAETGLVGTALFVALLLRSIFCGSPAFFVNSEAQRGTHLQAKGAQAGLAGFAVASIFGDYQYYEILYLQLFFVGAVRGYADSLAWREPDQTNVDASSRTLSPVLTTSS